MRARGSVAATAAGGLWLMLVLAGCGGPEAPPGGSGAAPVAAASSGPAPHELSPADASKKLQAGHDVFLLDVRRREEYDLCHIKGAVLIPDLLVDRKIAHDDLYPEINRGRSPRPDQMIVVCCSSGARSALAVDTLRRMGYSNVWSIQGGLAAWMKAGLPVEGQISTGP